MREIIEWKVIKNEKENDSFMIDIRYPDNINDIIKELHDMENQAEEKFNICIACWFYNNGENYINESQLSYLRKINININENNVIDGRLYFTKAEDFLDVWIQVMKKVRPNILINKFKHKKFERELAYGLF